MKKIIFTFLCFVFVSVSYASEIYNAIETNQPAIVKEIVRQDKTKISERDEYGDLPLCLAAEKGYIDIIKVLVDAGANINAKGIHGNTALHQAIIGGNLLNQTLPQEILNKTVVFLIDNGADINASGAYGLTPLHCAVKINYESTVKILLQYGADFRKKNDVGNTPLHTAAIRGSIKISSLLLKAGANINAIDDDGYTPLFGAIAHRIEFVNFFIDNGAAVQVESKTGLTPLIAAVYGNYPAVVDLLIHKGADVNSKNKDGKTPIFYAVERCNINLVSLLIKLGASAKVVDNNKRSLLSFASTKCDGNFYALLEKHMEEETK